MNFLTELGKGIMPNALMTKEQVEIAAEFIDELWRIVVFELVPDESKMLANAPLFTIPKPGQPGQWRVIADMKNSRQNDHIGKDLVNMPQASPGDLGTVICRGLVSYSGCQQVLPSLPIISKGSAIPRLYPSEDQAEALVSGVTSGIKPIPQSCLSIWDEHATHAVRTRACLTW